MTGYSRVWGATRSWQLSLAAVHVWGLMLVQGAGLQRAEARQVLQAAEAGQLCS